MPFSRESRACIRQDAGHSGLEARAPPRPSLPAKLAQPLKGIGAALLLGVIELAQVFDCGMIWGEATRESAGQYETFFGIENVTDRFEVERKTYLEFKARYLERWPDTGLPLKEKLAS